EGDVGRRRRLGFGRDRGHRCRGLERAAAVERIARTRKALGVSILLWLIAVLVLSVLGSLGLWLRHGQPTSLESGMDAFARGLRAVAPERADREQRERRSG